MQGGAKVYGLREFRSELKKLEDPTALQNQLRDANEAVAQMVVDGAKHTASSVSAQAIAAAASLRPTRTLNRAAVLLGSSAVPFALGAEFGSYQYTQFPAWRGSGPDAGYFLWPTIRSKEAEILQAFLDALMKAAEPAFPGAAGGSVSPNELIEYTTKAGTTRMATRAQVANWTKGSN